MFEYSYANCNESKLKLVWEGEHLLVVVAFGWDLYYVIEALWSAP